MKNKTIIAKSVMLTAIAVIVMLRGQAADAQDVLLQIDGDERNTYDQLMSILEQKKAHSTHCLRAHMDNIREVVNLTEAQVKKLTIAAKGAVVEQNEKHTDQLKIVARNSAQFEFVPGDPPQREGGEDKGVAVLGGRRMMSIRTDKDGTVLNTKIWNRAIENTLTERQIEKLNKWNQEREQRVRKAAVAMYVSEIDAKLFLSPRQLTQLTDWIDENIGGQLVARMNSNIQRRVFVLGNLNGRPPNIQINAEIFKRLTDPQQEIWKHEFQQEFERIQKVPLPVVTPFRARAKKNAERGS